MSDRGRNAPRGAARSAQDLLDGKRAASHAETGQRSRSGPSSMASGTGHQVGRSHGSLSTSHRDKVEYGAGAARGTWSNSHAVASVPRADPQPPYPRAATSCSECRLLTHIL